MLLKLTYTVLVFSLREKITALIEANKVVVLSGETGCGKTTQVKETITDKTTLS